MPLSHHTSAALISPRRVVVICPMEVERAAVHRVVRGRLQRDPKGNDAIDAIDVVRSGIGKHAIVAALERACAIGPPGLAILAGACGALRTVDDVPPIARVIDEHGRSWTSAFGMHEHGVTLIAVDRIVSTREDKQRLARSSGASIVDMESHAFAEASERLGVPWSVVRGVSDSVDEMMPEQVLQWIAADGRTRTLRAVMDLMRQPSLIPHLRVVLARSRRVFPRVGKRVLEVHDAWRAVTR